MGLPIWPFMSCFIGPPMADIQDLFKETIARFMENGLQSELDDELGYDRYDQSEKMTDNSRNGYSSKTLKTSFGDAEIAIPRDRKGEFDPQILKKNQTSISEDIEAKIISMYAKGMTCNDINEHIRDIYGIEVSESTISRITDKVLEEAKDWQQRPLESIYAVLFLDAIWEEKSAGIYQTFLAGHVVKIPILSNPDKQRRHLLSTLHPASFLM